MSGVGSLQQHGRMLVPLWRLRGYVGTGPAQVSARRRFIDVWLQPFSSVKDRSASDEVINLPHNEPGANYGLGLPAE